MIVNFDTGIDKLYRAHKNVIKKMQSDGWHADHFTLHQHRQVFASIMARRCIPPITLQRLLCHEDFSTTMNVYAKFSDDDSKGVVPLLVGFGP